MAVITTRTKSTEPTPHVQYAKYTSGDAGQADSVEMELPPVGGARYLYSVKMYNSSNEQIVDSTGTFTVSVKTDVNGIWESPPEAVIDATAPETCDWYGASTAIRVVPDSLSDVDHWVVCVSVNNPV